MKWFLAKVSYYHLAQAKVVREEYVIDATSFTEAEGILLRHISMIGKECVVKALNPVNFDGVLTSDGGEWFKVRILAKNIDDKDYFVSFLILAMSAAKAIDKAKEGMDISDFVIDKVERSKIVAVLTSKSLN